MRPVRLAAMPEALLSSDSLRARNAVRAARLVLGLSLGLGGATLGHAQSRLPAADADEGPIGQESDAPADLGLRGASAPADPRPVARRPTGPRDLYGGMGSVDPAPTLPSPKPARTKPKPKPTPSPRRSLPALSTYPSAPHPAGPPHTTAAPVGIPPIAPAPTVAAPPGIPAKPRPRPDDDPFAPVGIGLGSLRLYPYAEGAAGYDSNPARVAGGQGSRTEQGQVGAVLQSDWTNHSLRGSLDLGYTRYDALPQSDAPNGKAALVGRVDVTRETALDADVHGALSTQQPGTPGLPTSLTDRPLVTTYGTREGVTQKWGRVVLGLHGTIERTDNQDGQQGNGTLVPLSDENNTDYGGEFSVGYQLKPGIVPYVKASVDGRIHDRTTDSIGYRRDSVGRQAIVGSTFELTRLLTGSIGIGYGDRVYQDARLSGLRGPIFDSSLVWSATPLTNVTLAATTTQAETTLVGASGVQSNRVALGVSHALFRELTLGGEIAVQRNTYAGVSLRETVESAKATLAWNLSRTIVVKGSFSHERMQSTAPGSDYTANVFLVGLRLQR